MMKTDQSAAGQSRPEDTEKLAPWYLFWKHQRYIVTLLSFLGFFNLYSLRVNLSVAIVAMTAGKGKDKKPEFDWNNDMQGWLLAGFFYGYLTTQLLGGYFGRKYGGVIIFGTGIGIGSSLTLLLPLCATVNVWLLFAGRVLTGFCQGVAYPSLHATWSKWAPPLERSTLTTIAYSGSYYGTMFAMSAYAAVERQLGWQWIFYISGILGLIWSAFWTLLVREYPEKNKRISKAELDYIQTSLATKDAPKTPKKVPWGSLVTSMAVWSVIVSNFCQLFGFYTLITLLPKFFDNVYKISLKEAGVLASLPYLCMAIMMPTSGKIADFLIKGNHLSIANVRRLYNFLGFFVQGGFAIATAYMPNEVLASVMLSVSVAVGSFPFNAFTVNALDIAPQFASVIFGISNSFGTVPGIVGPIMGLNIVNKNNPTVQQWRIVFYICASVNFFGGVFCSIFTKGDVQPWALDDA